MYLFIFWTTVDIGRVNRIQRRHTCNKYDADKNVADGYDSAIFNPGDGPEVVLYDPKRVVKKTILPFNKVWSSFGKDGSTVPSLSPFIHIP